jgi:hypothetical protein
MKRSNDGVTRQTSVCIGFDRGVGGDGVGGVGVTVDSRR